MTVDFDRWAIETFAKGQRTAEQLVVSRVPMLAEPAQLADGHMAIGFGRRLKLFPISQSAATYMLRDQLNSAVEALRTPLLETCAVSPLTPGRIGVLLVLATILGSARMRQWQPLWEALKLGDYNRAVMEVMHCNLPRILGSSDGDQLRVVELLTTLLSGEVPTRNA